MARKGIVVDFVANVRDFLRGTDQAADALDDVADALDDVAREGDDATDTLEQDFRQMARDADRSFDKVGKSAKQGFDKVEDASENAGDVVKDEARQSAAELGSSFDGSFESITDGFRDVASSAGAELGGLKGVLIGVGGAAAIGLVTKIVEGIREADEKVRAAADTLFGAVTDTARESGISAAKALREGLLDETAKQAQLQDILGTDNVADALVEVNRLAQDLGISAGDVFEALTGGADDTARVLAEAESTKNRLIAAGQRGDANDQRAAEAAVTAATKLNRAADYKTTVEERALTAVRTVAKIEGESIETKKQNAGYAERAADAAERQATAAQKSREEWAKIEGTLIRSAARVDAVGTIRAERDIPR